MASIERFFRGFPVTGSSVSRTVLFLSGLREKKTAAVKKIRDNDDDDDSQESDNCSPCSFPETVLRGVKNSFSGWLAYMRHPARDAGLGLAFLYMTVLGFDNITYGFCLKQCVTESVLGGLVAVSAVFGVTGSVVFPVLRRLKRFRTFNFLKIFL